jgi:type IX secretion system PorP/SprF family membrane protein
MKRIFNISIFFLIAASCFAQQDAQYNQYIFNELIINPAYAGTKEVINANAFFSKQWVGVDGSPCSESVSIDVPATEKMGLGLQIINEYIGAQLHQSLFGSYSYKLRINDNYKLSLGLALGASYYTLNGNDLTTATPDDPAVPKYIAHQLMPDAKTGLFFYGDRFYAGLSVTELLANVIKNDPFYVEQARNYFLTSGYVFDILPKLKFKPSILIKHSTTIPSTIDINALFRYD